MDEIINTPTGLTEEEESLLETILTETHERDDLPLNSESLLIDESTSRFSSAIWFEAIQNQTVVLAGLGGIGSYVAFLLGRIRPNRVILYDDDVVEETNLSGQLFSNREIGNAKVFAVSKIMRDFSGYYNVLANTLKFTSMSTTADIMICGFDNMAARKVFYASWKSRVMRYNEEDRRKCLFIDGRLSAEEFQVFCITGTDDYLMHKYETSWLFDDSQAEETLCSYKQTTFCANMIASVMVNLFVNFVANLCHPIINRELPFLTKYDAERMQLKTEAV